MPFPRLVLAGTHSGSGKTTLSLAVMAALTRRGLTVQPFKTGPDYIDPPFHTLATGRISRNLDAWLLPETRLLELFRRHAVQAGAAPGPRGLSLIEGVMGLFDGQGTGPVASTAHLASILRAPVVLILNAEGLSLSAAALVSGYASFHPLQRACGTDASGAVGCEPSETSRLQIDLAGVILNRVSGPSHYAILKQSIEEQTGVPCFGFLAKNAVDPLPHRHLGLVPAEEQKGLGGYLSGLADTAEASLDLDGLLELACAAPRLPESSKRSPYPPGGRSAAEAKSVRIGIARDAAFSFYYQDNLDLLEELGAELVPFSPLRDPDLPPNLHGLYLGGGFPETFAAELEANQSMRASVRRVLENGTPAYAECGGMIYLCASLTPESPQADSPDRAYAMAEFFPHAVRMTARLQRPFGYVTLHLDKGSLLGPAGTELRAHEFHYTRLEPPERMSLEDDAVSPVYTARKESKDGSWSGGLSRNAALGIYPHLHFHSCPEAAASFVQACREYSKTKPDMGEVLSDPARGKAKCLMIQGTTSSAGKSALVTALCRIFSRRGIRVAPFKSQNMSLNSFITMTGGEIGRAQAVQAEAAGIEPSTLMNPVLLKPSGDQRSQVIVDGVARMTLSAKEYHEYRRHLAADVRRAYEELASHYELIIIEGAGSPAEINLREHDLANMGMAEIADAPVLLVGDIDRGGVFASLYGTVSLLEKPEQERILGLVVNKFRGDSSILEPGLRQIESLLERPVLGVLPYWDIHIDEEDSLSDRLARASSPDKAADLDIAVIRLPRLSNYTDFAVFDTFPDVSLRFVSLPYEVMGENKPDLLILPGTKNTLGDMEFLRKSEWADAIRLLHEADCLPIVGVCGGFQMLGKSISDPLAVESPVSSQAPGLGLFDMKTYFFRKKETAQRTITVTPEAGERGLLRGTAGMLLHGYVIHQGQTGFDDPDLSLLGIDSQGKDSRAAKEKAEGAVSPCGTIIGTYLHGVFDNLSFTRTLLNNIRTGKGLPPLPMPETAYCNFRQSEYDKLADLVEKHLDIRRIEAMIDGWQQRAKKADEKRLFA